MLASLQNGGLNQTTFLFLLFPCLFAWLLLLIISPTLMSVRVPPLLLLTLEVRSTGVKYSSLLRSPLYFRASSYLPLLSSKIFLHEDSLLILWFTALGICLSTDLGWFEEIFMYLGAESFLLKGLKVQLFKFSVTSRKSTVFKFEASWIFKPSNLKALIIFFCILEVFGPLLSGM